MRVFLDANVLFSAAKSDGAVRKLLALAARAGHECCADAYVVEEARRNIEAKAPGNRDDLEDLLQRVRVEVFRPADAALLDALPLPEKDRPVLAAAIRLGCDALVTGDRSHFGALYGKVVRGVKVLSPRQLLELLPAAC